MKTLNLTLALFIAVVTIAGQAWADSFSTLKVGTNVTINDSIWNSTYNPYNNTVVTATNAGNEDNETERLQDGRNTYTGQRWDFEGMFWNSGTRVLTLIGGWNFATGVPEGSSAVQVGDLFLGNWNNTPYMNGSTVVGKGFTATEVLDFSRTGGALGNSGTYAKVKGNFTTTTTTDVNQSNPFEYKDGGNATTGVDFTFNTGLVTETPFLGWKDSDKGNAVNNTHYFMQIYGLDDSEIYGNLLHITLACGNDTGVGQVPVPEPGTMMLFGFGMLGLAVYGKRRMNKEA
jgi:hypothetical protein